MNDNSTTMNSAPLEQMDKDFVMKAAAGSMMEIEDGKIAQENSTNERVKNFASMIVTDHSKVKDELMSFASSKGLTLNADSLMMKYKSHLDEMRKMKGKAFDAHYMNMMLNDHKKDVAEFEKASKMCKDQECLGFAAKTLPVLKMHLDSAQAIKKGKM
jgi:putative membrane protein